MARKTPESRNRYVDLLRAVSIFAVVLGHWIIAAPWIDGSGALHLDHMLGVQPWTRWLTLLFQVMPVFFLVGGYSNAASWDATVRAGATYGHWVAGRGRRLIGPVVPLLATWAVLAVVFRRFGVRPEMIREGSKLALVPLWFLAVYLLVVLLVPWTRAAWRRYGMASFWALVAAAVLMDAVRFWGGEHRPGIAWLNYLFVWVAVHQLGYLWRDGGLDSPRRAAPWAIGGGIAWVLLARFGPYPISMVGVPGDAVSNTLPPTIMLLALGAFQTGVLLSIERPVRKWLDREVPWAATILVNGTIMSVYLWHLTALALLIGLASLLGGIGLHLEPGTTAWWLARIPWIAALLAALAILLIPFGRFERIPPPPPGARYAAWRVIIGSILTCVCLALLALHGIGTDHGLGLQWGALGAGAVGVAMLGAFPWPGGRKASNR